METGLRVDLNRIGPRYFETLGIPLLQGRDFSGRDAGTVILSRALGERLWPGQSAIGKRISWPLGSGTPLEVIGVAADARYRSLIADAPLLLYVPALDYFDGRTNVIARTSGDPRMVAAAMQRAIAQIDKGVAVYNAEAMSEHVAESLWEQRMAALWIGSFS